MKRRNNITTEDEISLSPNCETNQDKCCGISSYHTRHSLRNTLSMLLMENKIHSNQSVQSLSEVRLRLNPISPLGPTPPFCAFMCSGVPIPVRTEGSGEVVGLYPPSNVDFPEAHFKRRATTDFPECTVNHRQDGCYSEGSSQM